LTDDAGKAPSDRAAGRRHQAMLSALPYGAINEAETRKIVVLVVEGIGVGCIDGRWGLTRSER